MLYNVVPAAAAKGGGGGGEGGGAGAKEPRVPAVGHGRSGTAAGRRIRVGEGRRGWN